MMLLHKATFLQHSVRNLPLCGILLPNLKRNTGMAIAPLVLLVDFVITMKSKKKKKLPSVLSQGMSAVFRLLLLSRLNDSCVVD